MPLKSIAKHLALLAACLLLPALPAKADIFLSGQFSLVQGEEPGTYEFTAQLPQSAASNDAKIIWPEGCGPTRADRRSAGGRVQFAYEIKCSRHFSPTDVIQTPWRLDGAQFLTNATGTQTTRTLQGTDQGITLPVGETAAADRTLGEIAVDYSWLGMLHIWMGWDHLAFVLCLCLLTRGRQLLWLVTAFTAGHSISLALAFFHVIDVPVPPVEAVIALSIAFMAREALRSNGMSDTPSAMKRHVTVVALFGLLHGLGFASALGELGVPDSERVPGLVFFNVGVEIGQLAFVACVTAVMIGLRAISAAQPVRLAALYGVGAIGCFWMIERVMAFQPA